MNNFTPYFDSSIEERINTQEEHNFREWVKTATVEQMDELHQQLKDDLAKRQVSGTKGTNVFKIACKAGTLRYQELERQGAKRNVYVGGPLTAGSILGAAVQGIIIGDLITDLITGDGWVKAFPGIKK